jgi:transposase
VVIGGLGATPDRFFQESEMECGPQNCPLPGWLNLPANERRAQRKAKAEELAGRGFKQADIAALLGVSQKTVSEYLIYTQGINQAQPKTATNPRGSGRRHGTRRKPERRATTPQQDKAIADRVLDDGKSDGEVRREFGVSSTVVRRAVAQEEGRREITADPQVNPATLSMSAQEKLQAAIRQHKRKLEADIDDRVRTMALEAIDKLLVHHKEKYARAERILKARKGVMDRATYRKILSCLHPDRLHAMGIADTTMIKRYEEAFARFTDLEDLLLDEKENPTTFAPMPATAAEWMRAKQKATETRRAKSNGRAMSR